VPRIRIEMPEAFADTLAADACGIGIPLSDLVRTDLTIIASAPSGDSRKTDTAPASARRANQLRPKRG
jgi:hypothetical protein